MSFQKMSLSISLLMGSPLVITSNLLIFAAWLRYHRLRSATNSLIISLSIADTGVGLFLPIALVIDISSPEKIPSEDDQIITTTYKCTSILCFIIFGGVLCFSSASILTLGGIAFDRLSSVAYPLRYNYEIKNHFVHRFLIASWIYSVIIGLLVPQLILRNNSIELLISWLSLVLYGPCLTTACIAYVHIYMVARGHARAIYSVEVSLNAGRNLEVNDNNSHSHFKYGLALALILGSVTICWLPIQFASLLDLWSGSKYMSDQNTRFFVASPIFLLSLLNPWLYGLRSSEIRSAALKLLNSIVTQVTGRPSGYIELSSDMKGYEMSYASNVRTIGVSMQSTVHMNNIESNGKSPNTTTCIEKNNLNQILLCEEKIDQV